MNESTQEGKGRPGTGNCENRRKTGDRGEARRDRRPGKRRGGEKAGGVSGCYGVTVVMACIDGAT
ncbi:MAG: hypothetical protein QGI83_20185 [Candidatus Latescibacteria bacterium]|nr:hypothetical protein [Candidatus Latescibacterota bacterium]